MHREQGSPGGSGSGASAAGSADETPQDGPWGTAWGAPSGIDQGLPFPELITFSASQKEPQEEETGGSRWSGEAGVRGQGAWTPGTRAVQRLSRGKSRPSPQGVLGPASLTLPAPHLSGSHVRPPPFSVLLSCSPAFFSASPSLPASLSPCPSLSGSPSCLCTKSLPEVFNHPALPLEVRAWDGRRL